MAEAKTPTDIPPLTATSPLDGYNPLESVAIAIRECPLQGKITLRGSPSDKDFIAGVKKVLKADLPDKVLTSIKCDGGQIFCTAYDEWLILLQDDQPAEIMDKLKTAFKASHHALVDVTDYYVEIAVTGENCLDLLAKGITLDLHESQFSIGKGTYTNWHQANVFLMRDGDQAFRMMIRWSFARYLWDYLIDSAQEYKSV